MRIISIFLILTFSVSVHADLQLAKFTIDSKISDSPETSPVIITESPYSYSQTVSNLKKAIGGKNYRLIRVQKVDYGYADKNKESSDLIVYFCNFGLVNVAVKIDNRIGQFLPCRITVIERDGKVYLMAMNPEAVGNVLGNARMKDMCNKVKYMYMDIMDEATI